MTVFEIYAQKLIELEFSGKPLADALRATDEILHVYSIEVGRSGAKKLALLDAFRNRDRGGVADTPLTQPIIDRIAGLT
jgi:hypothetical protein